MKKVLAPPTHQNCKIRTLVKTSTILNLDGAARNYVILTKMISILFWITFKRFTKFSKFIKVLEKKGEYILTDIKQVIFWKELLLQISIYLIFEKNSRLLGVNRV